MSKENAIRRAQLYGFLAEALLYPRQNWAEDENWTEEMVLVSAIIDQLDFVQEELDISRITLSELQAIHRHTFGAAGSLCYETEYGLPHEYRQSQEMADIAGFYQAFGFKTGGDVPERPDHVAVELEFMHVMALKEAYALESGSTEHVEICVEAQAQFLKDHLGRWIDLFAQSVAHNAPDSLFVAVARFASRFIQADAGRLGVDLEQPDLADVEHTPFDPDFSCATCEVPAQIQGFVRSDSIR